MHITSPIIRLITATLVTLGLVASVAPATSAQPSVWAPNIQFDVQDHRQINFSTGGLELTTSVVITLDNKYSPTKSTFTLTGYIAPENEGIGEYENLETTSVTLVDKKGLANIVVPAMKRVTVTLFKVKNDIATPGKAVKYGKKKRQRVKAEMFDEIMHQYVKSVPLDDVTWVWLVGTANNEGVLNTYPVMWYARSTMGE